MDFDSRVASQTLLASLPKRTAHVLEKRFGLLKSGKRFTLEAIGQTYGITRERVRQIECDGISRIKKTPVYAGFTPLFSSFRHYIAEQGGIVVERDMLGHFNPEGASGSAVRFLLTLCPSLTYRSETDTFHPRWGENTERMDSVEESLASVENVLLARGGTVSYEELLSLLTEQLLAHHVETVDMQRLQKFLNMSCAIGENYFGRWGHVSSPLVRPRGVRDLAYLVFQKEEKPLHFSDAAQRIRSIASPRRVHPQTVHNELIKDSRFVLVGRGTYGLAEWGFEPGTVRDIITRVLAQGPSRREDIVQSVMSRRQVKENTILINLQNRKHFVKLTDGTYTNSI